MNMRTAVQDHKNLYRVDGAYIVNEDDAAYQAALTRAAKRKQEAAADMEVESRIDSLEQKMDLILSLLQDKNKG